METNFSFLALGDSYTIGESVPLHKSFPYQTIQLLRKKGFNFIAPEIVAQTGWTSGELKNAIEEYSFLYTYDFVTLLIGVNNQYRGYAIEAYEKEFAILLSRAILLANKTPEHVFVLSIPDYSKTTFAKDLDSDKISSEIDQYNEVNKRISDSFGVQYVDITTFSREVTQDASMTAADGLHPSEKVYTKWASMLGRQVYNLLKAESVS
ncbi:SGNH/GDSL hydrolase family protein [Chitinophagaceae bacterium LB-8]|uniref:SGNH/GDSL hydrolase family protein n=1 Tax=Paraflavisolibacter caeni TaxID=2982496 RepID=A0A9X2XZ24_9BACT|nr:SGNH/GDSL hydrolase family protein [Paraflavisolibacter caeni]MCU7551521.1 SGNH/GDSL hydrolase family protein [Paraflavisolibacter caeni]